MPCFKGIAVSIHANGSPLPEYGIQKQSRVSRINSYIPVPQPQVDANSGKAAPAKFAISITLLTPNLAIPYSTPKANDATPYPKPQYVGELPSTDDGERLPQPGVVLPYIPITGSEHETIAAYIFFDGRTKEEVATLLRPGEETWVNSRWVQVSDSDGGGLAEREFLFREVGLERWLNGLDLEGHDAAAKVEKRKQKFERRRRRQEAMQNGADVGFGHKRRGSSDMRYGSADSQVPLEVISDNSSESSDDELPEAAGQIKVSMFRVIASGEIKKGEYSPQFEAHEDDDEFIGGNANPVTNTVDADVEHTTSFAKPKSLDPKTISTQTVTGIDGPEKPFATFTFFYRGDRQLQKMGVLPSSRTQQVPQSATKRRSTQLDFSNLEPLKTSGTVGFSAFREQDRNPSRRKKSRKQSSSSVGHMVEDSDEDSSGDEVLGKMEDIEDKPIKSSLGPEDAQFSGELADGVNRIRLKRAHSADPDSAAASIMSRKSPSTGPFGGTLTPPEKQETLGTSAPAGGIFGKSIPDEAIIGSPLKKHRPSLPGVESAEMGTQASSSSFPPALGDVLAKAEASQKQDQAPVEQVKQEDNEDEEL